MVNKTSIIDSTYRNFEMEVLAGESNLVTKVQDFFPFYFKFNVLKPKGVPKSGEEETLITPFICTVPLLTPLSECESWQLLLSRFVLLCHEQTHSRRDQAGKGSPQITAYCQ